MKVPRLFNEVLDVVASIRASRGATFQDVLQEIKCKLNHTDGNTRTTSVLVKQSLFFGTKYGLIKRKNGYYQLGLSKEDYAVFKKFRGGENVSSDESVKSFDSASSKKRSKSKSVSSESQNDSGTLSSRSSGQISETSKSSVAEKPAEECRKSSAKHDDKCELRKSNQKLNEQRNDFCKHPTYKDSRQSSASQRRSLRGNPMDPELCETVCQKSLHEQPQEYIYMDGNCGNQHKLDEDDRDPHEDIQ